MRRFAAALAPAAVLTAYALIGAPATAAPAWVTTDECLDGGGKLTPVGRGKAICSGGTWDQQLIHG
ncbi:hypothetical protein FAF44_15190 [Nonomuraea sp. MG754425]|uniref:hypothetical protein n=1 Tax=Nonomuraea sp. MG754425 TaxID=2570319 RepID=UPI001F19E4CA|nr:hypothetical protein [Nonomuraea sp. MG754425]MCF6469724.1 hypothetical protein [Nonomuraea sp. MG754425]